MIRTQLYLPESQYEELKKLAASYGKTFAAFSRELLAEKLKEVRSRKQLKKPDNAISVMLASLKKVSKWKEKGVVRKGSTEHDLYLYGRKAFF